MEKQKINDISTGEIIALGEKSSELAQQISAVMSDLGVNRLANFTITHVANSTHGAQEYLHIDGHDGDLFRADIENDNSIYHDYGELHLPYSYPRLETVIEFLESIPAINAAITEKQNEIKSLLSSDIKINS